MAKKQRKPSHAYKGCPKGTRKLTGVDKELDEARIWQTRQMHKRLYWKLKRRIAAHGLLAVYRERKAARTTGAMSIPIPDMDRLAAMFDAQYPDLPIGGFLNPTFVSEHRGDVEFRCFYDNYDNEEDSWTWYWNRATGRFYN